jgi:hypothetical protein
MASLLPPLLNDLPRPPCIQLKNCAICLGF